jgi:hypothetical protein
MGIVLGAILGAVIAIVIYKNDKNKILKELRRRIDTLIKRISESEIVQKVSDFMSDNPSFTPKKRPSKPSVLIVRSQVNSATIPKTKPKLFKRP